MNKTLYVLNGPNLNLLGTRQPELYGHETLDDVKARLVERAAGHAINIVFHQSNHEGEIVDQIHAARQEADGIIINPAAYSHTSVAVLDALNAYENPVVEVHISNIHKRESYRQHSFVSARAEGVIAGLGTLGYLLALDYFAEQFADTGNAAAR